MTHNPWASFNEAIDKLDKENLELACLCHSNISDRISERYSEKIREHITPNKNINKLCLHHNRINEGIIHILNAIIESNITDLNVVQNQISDDTLEYFCNLIPKTKIRSIDLSDNRFARKGLFYLCNIFDKLDHLRLSKNVISGSLKNMALHVQSIVSLDISSNWVDGEIYDLCESVSYPQRNDKLIKLTYMT